MREGILRKLQSLSKFLLMQKSLGTPEIIKFGGQEGISSVLHWERSSSFRRVEIFEICGAETRKS